MLILKGTKTVDLSKDELTEIIGQFDRVHIDLGTGDGRNIYKLAINDQNTFYIGIDPVKENLFDISKKIIKRGCRTSKYFLLGGSPALCPNGGEIGCDFAPIPYKHSSFPDIPFGMPDFKLFCFQPLKSMLSLMKKDDSPFFRSESCNEAY